MALINLHNSNTIPQLHNLVTRPAPRPGQERRHCFVGEIVRVGTSRFYHTETLVKDRADTVLRIGFTFPDTEGVPAKFLKRGCTMLILSASRKDMPGGGQGIEVHNPRFVKMLPFRMIFLISLGERIFEFRSIVRRKRLCFGCGVRRYELHGCLRCKMFYFCGRACQEVGIYEKTHRADCAVLRDPDMSALFLEQWEDLEEFRSVSLQTHG